MEQRDKLGLSPRGKPDHRHYREATDAMDKAQVCAVSGFNAENKVHEINQRVH
jgi:hypothetical protein